MTYEAFISYRRVDTEIATSIYDTLTEERHQVFFDVNSLLTGDFTVEIRTAIRDSELVVALLTCESVTRMADAPETDMVRKELETARQEARPIQFLWLLKEGEPQSALYHQLAAYPEDELLGWLSRQNIMPFTAEAGDVRRICGKVLETLEAERRRRFEQLRTSTRQELHQKFAIGSRQYVYHGNSRLSVDGKSFPYGEGTMIDESSPFARLVYEGIWDGDENFSGTGTVYQEEKGGSRIKLYQGHWWNLEYHDVDGRLFDEGTCVYQGCLVEGKRPEEKNLQLFHMKLFAREDTEKKFPLYSGIVQTESGYQDFRKCLYGEEQLDSETQFRGWYRKGSPAFGELCFLNGKRYSGELGRSYAEGKPRNYCGPNGFGRMIYPDGRVYEGEWRDGDCRGYGIAVYPGGGMEVRVEGGFSAGAPSGSLEVDAKVSVRYDGEQHFHTVYTSPANNVHIPGEDSQGYGRCTFRDGSVYDGILKGLSPHQGRLYTADGREYRIGQSEGAIEAQYSERQEAADLVLRCLDELWEVFRPVMEHQPKAWREFQCSALAAAVRAASLRRDEWPNEYPRGASEAKRVLAACEMPPSRLALLPEDELRSIRNWLSGQNKLDRKALEERAEKGEVMGEEDKRILSGDVMSEEDKRILSGDVRTLQEAMRYIDLLPSDDPDFHTKAMEMSERMLNLPVE